VGKEEVVDLVDSGDGVIGRATLDRCLGEGLRHRAVAVLVERSDGRVVLQVRSKSDHWHPGRWTLSSTGHVGAGESYAAAAKRELAEELGLSSAVKLVKKLFLPKVRSRGSVEWEVVSLFRSVSDEAAHPDPGEVDSTREVTLRELRSELGRRRLTPDAKILIRTYLTAVKA